MGFYFRKSVRFGPFRVNFSKSGVGLSAGIPGLRIGTGPRGNYIQAGAHGFYYRAALPSTKAPRADRSAPAPILPSASGRAPSAQPPIPDNTLGAFEAHESANVDQMVDSSSNALVEEIHNKHKRIRWWRILAVLSGFALFAAWINDVPQWAVAAIAVAGIVLSALAFKWDIQRKLTILHYELNAQTSEAFGRLVDAGARLSQCQRMWHLKGSAAVLDKKYHAGAAITVSRARAAVMSRLPPYLASNIDPLAIVLSKLTLYCFPDRILVYQGSHVGAISYSALTCQTGDTRFIEDEAPPRDTEVVGRTWRYVNKSGGPDKRFKNNPQLPVCRYGVVSLTSGSGLNEILEVSNARMTSDFEVAVKGIAAACQ